MTGLPLFAGPGQLEAGADVQFGEHLAQVPLHGAAATEAGVDLLTLGGTKNGLLYGDAVVFLRPELARRAKFARKQAGQLAVRWMTSFATTCPGSPPACTTSPNH